MKIQKNDVDLDEKDEYTSSSDSSSYTSSDYDADDLRLCNEEYERSGNFDFDFSRVRYTFHFKLVLFNEHYFTDEPDTDRDLMKRLSIMAIKKRNEEEGTNLELVNVVKANFHPSAAYTFYITFEATNDNDQSQTYQTMIGYLPMDIRIVSVRPKP